MVSITAGVETTNESPVFVPRTNARPQRPVSVSRSHQHQRPPCGVCGQSQAEARPAWPMEAAIQITAESYNVQSTERLGWRWDALITYFCF